MPLWGWIHNHSFDSCSRLSMWLVPQPVAVLLDPFKTMQAGALVPIESRNYKGNPVLARISRRKKLELSFGQAVLQRVHTWIWPSIPCCSTHIVYRMTIPDRNLHNKAAISRVLSAKLYTWIHFWRTCERGPTNCNLHKLGKLYHMRTEG